MKKGLLFLMTAAIAAALVFYINAGKGAEGAGPIRDFIEKNFVLETGGVLIENTDRATVLSESVGLYLAACVKSDDRARFDRTYDFTRKELVSSRGLLHWKMNVETGVKEPSSASIDDLRVAGALLAAWEKWKDARYLEGALRLSDAIKAFEVSDWHVVDSASWQGDGRMSKIVNISYLDLPVMKSLSAHDPDWGRIFEKSNEVVLRARMPNGLFREEFNLETGRFRRADGNMINQLLTALHLAEAGVPESEIGMCGFLKPRLGSGGAIRDAYDESGKALSRDECAAVYALASRLFRRCGEDALEKAALRKMYMFEIKDRRNKDFGGFGIFPPLGPRVFNSYDSLEALLTVIDKER